MRNSKYRYLIPNAITFISLFCGVFAMLATIEKAYMTAGILILTSYILDLFDGASARKLNASSAFGLELDSLVDMVSLGVAPAVLTYGYLQNQAHSDFWVWLGVAAFVFGGAFRLARFNLLPPKLTGRKESIGLTISAAGATLALAVLADLSPSRTNFNVNLPSWGFVLLMFFLSILMISRIPYPSFAQVAQHKWVTPVSLAIAFLLWYLSSFLQAWFICNIAYLTLSLGRASILQQRQTYENPQA
jgi:CDP-diacylglycerol---serine O-phosphatidyltransferase